MSGFFAPHLETRGVEVRYVTSLGARAYDSAGKMLRGASGDGAPDLFFELAANFERFADLLNKVEDFQDCGAHDDACERLGARAAKVQITDRCFAALRALNERALHVQVIKLDGGVERTDGVGAFLF